MSEESKAYTVSQYSKSIDRLLKSKVPAIWVQGVLTQLQVRGSVAYLTLTEYATGSEKPIANIALFCWARDFTLLQNTTRSAEIPFEIEVDLKVSFLIEAEFYVPFGKFQPKIIDIDTRFTQGEMALTRDKILKKLTQSGLLHKNKNNPWPKPALRIGLITAPESAAYHDFTNALNKSPWNFEIHLQSAVMQGDRCSQSIIQAFSLMPISKLDVIVLTRGGGAKTDLVYFDAENLCEAIANFSLPVISGIGHQIDNSLTDLVAWTSRMTPTDCAKLLIDQIENEWASLLLIKNELVEKSMKLVSSEAQYLKDAQVAIEFKTVQMITFEKQNLKNIVKSLKRQSTQKFIEESSRFNRNLTGLTRGSQKLILQNELKLKGLKDSLKQKSKALLQLESESLKLKTKWVSAISPSRTLERGYTLTRKIKTGSTLSVNELSVGDLVQTETNYMVVHSEVQKIIIKEK